MFGASGVTGLNIYSMIVAIVGSIVVLLIYNAVIRSSAPGGNIGKPLADCSPRPTGFGREEVALGLLRAQVRRRHQTKGLVAYSEDWALILSDINMQGIGVILTAAQGPSDPPA
jgi:hypothetical protein